MVDTARTIAALQTILADNTTGAISPQDVRDLLVSVQFSYGEIYVATPAATSITDTTSYFDLAGTYTFDSGNRFDMNTNGQLRYTGTPTIEVFMIATLSLTSVGNNQLIHLRLAKTGTSLAATDTTRFIATGADVGAMSVVGITNMATNDYLTVEIRNETSTANATAEHLTLVGLGFAI